MCESVDDSLCERLCDMVYKSLSPICFLFASTAKLSAISLRNVQGLVSTHVRMIWFCWRRLMMIASVKVEMATSVACWILSMLWINGREEGR